MFAFKRSALQILKYYRQLFEDMGVSSLDVQTIFAGSANAAPGGGAPFTHPSQP